MAAEHRGGAPVASAVASSSNPNHSHGDVVKLLVDPTTGALFVLNVGAGGGGTSSLFSAAFPLAGTAIGASDGVNMVPLLVDGSGNLKIAGSFAVTPEKSATATAPAQTTVGTTASTILASNVARKRCTVQNVGTTVIKLGFGATPTQTAFHVALPAGGSTDDGSSPVWQDTLWTGAIQAISSSAGGLAVVTEMT